MLKNKRILKSVCAALCLIIVAAAVVGCAEKKTKDGRFDYFNSKMSKFVLISPDDYMGMVAKLPAAYLVTDETVQSYIDDQLFNNKIELNGGESQVDQPIRYGDTAYIFYEGFMDGVAFSGGSNMTNAPSNPYALSIGSGSFIDGFEEQLIGVVPNRTGQENRVKVEVTFPEVYPQSPDLAGKKAEFYVWVVRAVQYEIPELNDKTIKEILKYQPADKNATGLEAEYRAYVKKNLEAVNLPAIQSAAIEDLLDQLTDKVTFKKIPESELEYYHDTYMTQYRESMEKYSQIGYKFDDFDDFMCQYLGLPDGADWETQVKDGYTDVIKKHMICHAIAQIEQIELTNEEYEAEIQYYIDQASYNGQTLTRADVVETLGEYTIRDNAMYSKICSMLYDNSTVIYE